MGLIKQLLQELLDNQTRPGPLYVVSMTEDSMDNIRIRIAFPPVTDVDVEKREFSYKVNELDPVTEEIAKDLTTKEYVFGQGSNVHLELVDIDDAGNRSAPSVRDFVAADTVPPSQPGDIGVEIVGEE